MPWVATKLKPARSGGFKRIPEDVQDTYAKLSVGTPRRCRRRSRGLATASG